MKAVYSYVIVEKKDTYMASKDRVHFFLSCIIAVMITYPHLAHAECPSDFPLKGSLSVQDCDPKTEACIDGIRALYEYGEKLDDGGDEVITVSVMSSPWRIYGPDMRILSSEELAATLKKDLNEKTKSVKLYASWTEYTPQGRTKSLAQELSESLDGFPVTGIDGFLWMRSDGTYYSTKQAFTVGGDIPYRLKPGDDLMQSLPYGSYVYAQEHFITEKDGRRLRYAAVGWDVSILCPEKALQTFELAASFSDSVSAYNAAVMRLERGQEGDFEKASQLLKQAADDGDEKAKSLLVEIKAE